MSGNQFPPGWGAETTNIRAVPVYGQTTNKATLKLKIFSGTANPQLAANICSYLGTDPGPIDITHFPDGETFVKIKDSVRGEDCFIIHYTKTVVAAFGEEENWGQPLGLKTEIVPLTRPFANYTGNVFGSSGFSVGS